MAQLIISKSSIPRGETARMDGPTTTPCPTTTHPRTLSRMGPRRRRAPRPRHGHVLSSNEVCAALVRFDLAFVACTMVGGRWWWWVVALYAARIDSNQSAPRIEGRMQQHPACNNIQHQQHPASSSPLTMCLPNTHVLLRMLVAPVLVTYSACR